MKLALPKNIDKSYLAIATVVVGLYTFIVAFGKTPPGLAPSIKYINTLDPTLRPITIKFIRRAYLAGIPIIITSGYRSHARQAALYAQGRTTPGKRVTNAKPGTSWHNYRLAFDVARYEDGVTSWPEPHPMWTKLGIIGKKLRLEHGAQFGDKPHFDYHPNLTLAQVRAGKKVVA